ELLHRVLVRLEIRRVAGEQIAALRGFGVDDERHHIVQPRLHLERSGALSVGDVEPTIAELRKDQHGDRNDYAKRKRQKYFEWKGTGHPALRIRFRRVSCG